MEINFIFFMVKVAVFSRPQQENEARHCMK